MALFGHKPAAPAPAANAFSMAVAAEAKAEARRKAALNNMTRRKIQSNAGNYINSKKAPNNAAYRNQFIRNSKGIPPVEPTDPLDEEEEELARLSQGSGGLTEAQIEEAVNNI